MQKSPFKAESMLYKSDLQLNLSGYLNTKSANKGHLVSNYKVCNPTYLNEWS